MKSLRKLYCQASGFGILPTHSIQFAKRIRIVNTICIFFGICCPIIAIKNWIVTGGIFGILLALLLSSFCFTFLYLNSIQKTDLTRIILGPTFSLLITLIFVMEGYKHSIEYVLLIIPIGAYLFFEDSEVKSRRIYLFLTLLVLILPTYLAVTNFEGILPILANEPPARTSIDRAINYVASLSFLLYIFQTLFKENATAEIALKNHAEVIAAKRAELKTILDNISVGIFTISNCSLKIDDERSSALVNIFDLKSILDELTLDSVLLDRSTLDEESKSMIKEVLRNSIGEDLISFEINSHILPKELILLINKAQRFLEIDWSTVHTRATTVEKILICCRDMTELRQYQLDSARQNSNIEKIIELVAVDHRNFIHFYDSSTKFLVENSQLINHDSSLDRVRALRIIFINLHTIKGNARTLGLKSLTTLIHKAESAMIQAQSGGETELDLVRSEIATLSECLAEYAYISNVKLNRGEELGEQIRLTRNYVTLLADRIISGQALEEQDVLPLLSTAYFPAHVLVKESIRALPRLGKDLGKPIPQISCSGLDGVFLTIDSYNMLSASFVHIIRNTMDHGLETSEEREQKGKRPEGQIQISGWFAGENFILLIEDDGRGMAINKIEEIAIQKSYIKVGVQYTVKEVAELIFEPGFSTTQSVTEISGRGVGMGAVREFLLNLGGQLDIEIGEGREDFLPFKFKMSIPIHHIRFYAISADKFRNLNRSNQA